jgi:hypothetical protein
MTTKGEIEEAVIAVLHAIQTHESVLPPRDLPQPSPDEVRKQGKTLGNYLRDPVGAALRSGIRQIGELASESLDGNEMSEIASAVVAKAEDRAHVADLIDQEWGGLIAKVEQSP